MGNETFYGDGLMKFVHDIFLISLCTGTEGDMGVYGIEVLSFFFKRYFGNFDSNVRYCGIIQPCGMRFFILQANGIQ